MQMRNDYLQAEPTRAEVNGMAGAAIIEFGTPWCGYCRAAQPVIAEALRTEGYDEARYLKVEDGKGKPLGRSYQVKLWPTLIFLRDGQEVARVVRPHDARELRAALRQLGGGVRRAG